MASATPAAGAMTMPSMVIWFARAIPYASTPPLNAPLRPSFFSSASTHAGGLGGSAAAAGFSSGVLDALSAERSGELRRGAVAHVMHVHHMRCFVRQMIMDGGDLETRGLQVVHHRIHFVFEQNQIAHYHGAVVRAGESGP